MQVVPAFEFLSMPHVYTVRAGDTLDSIAHAHGISLNTLVARNKITECVHGRGKFVGRAGR